MQATLRCHTARLVAPEVTVGPRIGRARELAGTPYGAFAPERTYWKRAPSQCTKGRAEPSRLRHQGPEGPWGPGLKDQRGAARQPVESNSSPRAPLQPRAHCEGEPEAAPLGPRGDPAGPLAQRGVQVLHLTVQSAALHDPEPVDTVLHPHGLEADGEGGEEEQAREQDLARVDLNEER